MTLNKFRSFFGTTLPILTFAFLSSAPAWGAIGIDARVSTDQGSAKTTVSVSALSTTSGNELLLAFVSTDYNSGTNTKVNGISGGGLTWALVVRANAQSGTAEVWRAFAPAPLSNVTVTATLSQSVVSSMTVMSFTGVDTSGSGGSGAIGAMKSASAKSGAPTVSLVTTRNGSWVFAVGNDYDNAIARTPGAGQSLVHQDLAPVGDAYWVQMQNSATALSGTNVTINDTAPTGDRYNLAAVEILTVAGSGGGSPASITPTSGGGQSATEGTVFAAPLVAIVKDSGGNAVSGATVTFAAPGSGASGAFTGGNTAVTNASGVATSGTFTANSTAGGPYTVTATVGGVVTPANFALTNTPGPPNSITPTSGGGQSATEGTVFAAPLVAIVKDSGGNAVSGATVTFAAPGSGASGTFAGGNTAVTNASGVATSGTFTANSTAGGPYTVTATVGGVATPANFALTNTPGPPNSITPTSGGGQSATVGTAFGAPLVAIVKDSGGNAVSGATVTFAAPGSGASGTFAGGNTALTNASGVATSGTFTANSTAGGPYTVTATVGGVATPANFALTNVAGATASSIAPTSGGGQSAAEGMAFAAPLVATVKDSGSNPVSGVTVTFTAPGSGASGTFTGGNTATTNASGVATSGTFTANSTAGGSYTVTAMVGGVATPANFALTNTPGPPNTITPTSGGGQSATEGTAFAAPLVATVKDSGGNLVSGVTVMFTAPGSGASGTFAGGNTAITNTSGVAASGTITANTIAGGPYTVTATVGGVATPANFALTNTAGAPASISATSGSGQSTAINTAFGVPLVATVKDSGGNSVSGASVMFTAPGSGASGTFAGGVNTSTTNASGAATSVTFAANNTAGGPYNVTAAVGGVATLANFALTNTSSGSQLLYPDLQDIIPTAKIFIAQSSGKMFQYTHDTLNAGPGPLVIQPVYNPASGTYQGTQYIYTHSPSGTWTVAQQIPVAGAFIFDAAHGHFHFPFTTYGLYTVAADGTPGISIATSGKISFCIDDSFIYLPTIPNAGQIGNLGSCNDPTTLRGLNIGAVDEYDQTDPGQSIAIDGVPDGTYWLRAIVDPQDFFAEGDKTNNETDVELTISGTTLQVLNTVVPILPAPPAISLTAPSAGTVSGTIQLTASTLTTTGVQYLIDGQQFGSLVTASPYTVTWDTTTAPNGTHWLAAQTTGPTGRIGTSAVVSVVVANSTTAPPTATLTNPANGSTVSATVTLAANVSSGLGIANVTFYLDSQPIGTPLTSPPYMTTWDTQTATSGQHVITVSAIDITGAVGNSAPVTVTVDNSHPANVIGKDVTVSTDGSGALTTPAFSMATDGELLVVFVAYDGPPGSAQTAIVSGGGFTWLLAKRSNSQAGTAEIWTAIASNASPNVTITAQPGIGGIYHGSLTLIAFTNASGVGIVGQASAPSGAPDIFLPGVSAGNWVFAVGNDWDKAVARTPVSGQVVVHQRVDTAVGDTYWVQSTAAPSTANALVDIHDSAPTTDQWNYAAAEVVATRQ